MTLTDIQKSIQTFGFSKTLFDLTYKAVNSLTYARILQGMTVTMETLDPKYLKGPEQYTYRILTPEQVTEFAKAPTNNLPEEFLDYARSKGDECFAILDGDRLAAYGWYSWKPTRLSSQLTLTFSPEWVYMYRGFTHPDYRGQRLHAIGMANALHHYSQKGFKGLISYVEVNNYRSLRSVYRMGYRNFGKVYVLQLGPRFWIHADKGCEPYAFNVIPTPHHHTVVA